MILGYILQAPGTYETHQKNIKRERVIQDKRHTYWICFVLGGPLVYLETNFQSLLLSFFFFFFPYNLIYKFFSFLVIFVSLREEFLFFCKKPKTLLSIIKFLLFICVCRWLITLNRPKKKYIKHRHPHIHTHLFFEDPPYPFFLPIHSFHSFNSFVSSSSSCTLVFCTLFYILLFKKLMLLCCCCCIHRSNESTPS